MTNPIIGLTLDHEANNSCYSLYPWYAIRENYLNCVADFEATAIALPCHPEAIESYVELLDGLIVTGGDFDISPEYYGQQIISDKVSLKEKRTNFELALIKAMLAENKPILGICGGQQLLAVALGCSLIQHIPDKIPNALAHEQPNPRNEAGHKVQIKHGTILYDIVQQTEIDVNSAHHQAVDTVGKQVTINAVAPDGIIEGIEHTGYKFCVGVQWHPEFYITPADKNIFRAFVAACR